jgi:hypothetical protein
MREDEIQMFYGAYVLLRGKRGHRSPARPSFVGRAILWLFLGGLAYEVIGFLLR